jgi:hypothetical protein
MQCNYKESVNFLDALASAMPIARAISVGRGLRFEGELKGCSVCGKVHYRMKYCSVKCGKMAQDGGAWRACQICGTQTSKPRTCSIECGKKYKKVYSAKLYQSKRDQELEYAKAYYRRVKDSPQYKAKARRSWEGYVKKLKESPKLRMKAAIRSRVMMSMIRRNTIKTSRTFELIGCTGAELAAHIEKQFKRGMSWENYGSKWHVDHITPLSYFDMSNPDDQRRAWNWQNLRPLWALQNITEGNKRGD